MTIQFRKIDPSAPDESPASLEPQADSPWLPPLTQTEAEKPLLFFLKALLSGRYHTTQPLLFTESTLHGLLRQPHPSLTHALQHHVDDLLTNIAPRSPQWSSVTITPHIWSLAVVTYNCLLHHLEDTVISFTRALLATIPPARTRAEALGYHALLVRPAAALADWPPDAIRTQILQALINRSPLTALYHLHLHTPPPLTRLAADLMRWWRRKALDPAPWAGLDDWLDTLTPLLAEPRLAAYLRHRWLSLPEEHWACRNLGLLLEALRRRHTCRDLSLSFYEAYQYTHVAIATDNSTRRYRHWPLLQRIETLLRANGPDKVALALNRIGNEYLLKFWPLIQYIIAEDGLPHDYEHLTLDFVRAIRPLLQFATVDTRQVELQMGKITFVSEDTP